MSKRVQSARVLLVYADQLRIEVFANELRLLGYVVDLVQNVPDVRSLLEEEVYAAIVISRDAGSLSGRAGDGYALATTIRGEYPALPIIVTDRKLTETHVCTEDGSMQIVWDRLGWLQTALEKVVQPERRQK